MARPTYPRVVWDENAMSYRAEMVDKKTGRIWGYGHGETRQAAIKAAAIDQPPSKSIKRAIGWVTHHPFLGGAAVGAYMAYHHAKQCQTDLRLGDLMAASIIFGTAAWIISKIAGFFSRRQVSFKTE